MIERIVTAGQVGDDQGALRAARVAGIAPGGFAPKGCPAHSSLIRTVPA